MAPVAADLKFLLVAGVVSCIFFAQADDCEKAATDKAKCSKAVDADGAICFWCEVSAVPSACHNKSTADQLPPAVFDCKSAHRGAKVRSSLFTAAGGISMNCLNFANGLRLTVPGAPATASTASSQELLLDTGSSTLAFCATSLASSVENLKTDYLSCNTYGDGDEGYWGPFYKGAINIGSDLVLDEAYFSIMQQEVKMTCGGGLQGIFGVAFKQLDQAAYHPGSLNWPSGSVGSCPNASTYFVGPLMQYLKQETPEGRLGIYWSGQVGTSEGMLYVGPTAVTNSHYTQGFFQQAKLGETGFYNVNIEQVSFAGLTYPASCNHYDDYSHYYYYSGTPCFMDTGTPVINVPPQVYDEMSSGQTGQLSMQLSGANGSPVTLEFDAAWLVQNQYVAPSEQGAPIILGLPLWATYYTVFNVYAKTVDFVQHGSAELLALKNHGAKQVTIVV